MEKEIYGFKPEEVELIRKTVGKDAVNEAELHRFLYRAHKLGLNPLDNTIYLQVRSRKKPDGGWEKTNVIIVGIDGFRAVGDGTGKMSGIKRWVEYDDKGNIKNGVAQVFRKDWQEPAMEVAPFREFCQMSGGKPTGMWVTMPETMVKKCAEAAAHRMAWPAALSGIYIPEEMMRDDDADDTKKPGKDSKAGKEAPKVDPPKVETPKVDPPKADPPKADTTKVDTTSESSKATPPPAAETPKEAPVAEAPKETPIETPAASPKAETPATEQPKTETPAGAGDVDYEYQVKITSAPAEAKGKVVIVGTDMLKDDELNLVGTAEEIKAVLLKLEPGNVVELNGLKKENGKIFVLVEAIKVNTGTGSSEPAAVKPAEQPAEKPAEQPAAEKTAEQPEAGKPEPPKEDPTPQPDAVVSKVRIAVTKEPKAGDYEDEEGTCEVFYLSGTTDKGVNKVAFCKSTNDKCAFPFTCAVIGDVVEISGKEIEFKGKKVILVSEFEIVQQAVKAAS